MILLLAGIQSAAELILELAPFRNCSGNLYNFKSGRMIVDFPPQPGLQNSARHLRRLRHRKCNFLIAAPVESCTSAPAKHNHPVNFSLTSPRFSNLRPGRSLRNPTHRPHNPSDTLHNPLDMLHNPSITLPLLRARHSGLEIPS